MCLGSGRCTKHWLPDSYNKRGTSTEMTSWFLHGLARGLFLFLSQPFNRYACCNFSGYLEEQAIPCPVSSQQLDHSALSQFPQTVISWFSLCLQLRITQYYSSSISGRFLGTTLQNQINGNNGSDNQYIHARLHTGLHDLDADPSKHTKTCSP